MKIEAGSKAIIYCLSEKPEGTIISVGDKNVIIEIERGTLTVDKDDIIEGDGGVLKVLNYSSIEEKKKEPTFVDKIKNAAEKFADDMMETIQELKDKDKDIYSAFMHYVRNSTSDTSSKMFPLPCLFEMKNNTIAMAGLAIPVPQVYASASGIIAKEKPSEMIFGTYLDNNVPEGKIDPKYKTVFCIFRMKRDRWMYGVIGYNNRTDLKNQEPDWNNPVWTEKMKALLGAGGAIPIPQKVGTAYGGKINITLWRENSRGHFYEGDVIVENLDPLTQRYVKENNLDLNFSIKENRDKIAKFFDDNDMKLDFKFMNTGEGFINLMVTNKGLIFTDRRSKTRAILEALETIAKEKYANENDNSKSGS